MGVLKVKVISLPYIFQVLYVLCFTRPRYQVSVYRTIGPLVLFSNRFSKTAYHTVQQSMPDRKQYISKIFVIGFHLGAVKNRKGHYLKNLQILTGKDFQIPAHADVKRTGLVLVATRGIKGCC